MYFIPYQSFLLFHLITTLFYPDSVGGETFERKKIGIASDKTSVSEEEYLIVSNFLFDQSKMSCVD